MKRRAAFTASALALLVGCASTAPKAAFHDVAHSVEERSGHRVVWDRAGAEHRDIEDAVDRALSGKLTVDSAVQVALLANPRLRAELEELSVGQADLVQAGLLKNPVFTFGRTAWDMEHIDPNLFATIEQEFLDVLVLPLKKRVAAAQLEATKLEVGDHVLDLAAQVRTAFFTAQAAEQVVAMRRLVAEAAEAATEIARRQHDAGTMNDLNLSSELALAAQTQLDRRRAEGEAVVARENLNKLLGLWGPRTAWTMSDRLPDLPQAEPPLERLESLAMEKRLDVGAARRNVQAIGYALSLGKTTRWTGTVNVAVEAGRLRQSKRFSFGPSVAIEIPLFDQRQAQIARLEALHRQAEHELSALAIDIRADVRAARARVLTSRGLVVDFMQTVVPVRENVVRFSQEQYDAMLLGVYPLIQAKQAEFEAYRESIEALRDYWIAKSDLERATGTRVRASVAPPSPNPGASFAPPSHTGH